MRLWTLSLSAALILISAAQAQDKKNVTINDPAKAGPGYAVQGEYLTAKDAEEPHGAQVIALGGGKFRVVHYEGGLPGAGWKRGDEKESVEGETKDGVTTFKTTEWTARIKDGLITVTDSGGNEIAKLKKLVRKSPTLAAKPPTGATVLFDGKTAEHFKGGKIVMENLLAANCETKKKLSDHTLHLEFRTPFKPYARGQQRGNSGVYAQGRYEIQVLDSFGLEGKNNECGGIYSIAEPAVNMCYPPLTWQTYDIEFTAARYEGEKKVKNARITVRHNGVVIHKDLELTKGTPGKYPEGPGPAPLYLQGHGNPVVYRNIWVVEKSTAQ